MKFNTVYGVDFSGARRAGRTTWVARFEPVNRSRLRLLDLANAVSFCRADRREGVIGGLVESILRSRSALWALNFPFGFPIEVMAPDCTWAGQFDFLRAWGEDAYGSGVECYRRGLALGGKGHLRRLTDTEAKTPFDAYYFRIIYQTFYGMRDLLGPLRSYVRTAILPFHAHRLKRARRVIVEACPATTLKRMGLPHRNYKQPQGGPLTRKRRRTRREILAGLAACVEMTPRHRSQVMRDGGADALDAVLCGVGAWRCWHESDHAAIGRHPRYSREGRHYA